MQRGPSHHPLPTLDVGRMVSEDSRQLDESFLLIFRTRRIVTAGTSPASSAGYSGFPAYSQMRTVSLPIRGATMPEDTALVLIPGKLP
jgi:hypothetical protein